MTLCPASCTSYIASISACASCTNPAPASRLRGTSTAARRVRSEREEINMPGMPNRDVFSGNWKQLAGKAKEKWGKLTNDELTRSEGRAEQLTGLIQERYGKTREAAEAEVKQFIKDCGC